MGLSSPEIQAHFISIKTQQMACSKKLSKKKFPQYIT